jgi:hypothetical protein
MNHLGVTIELAVDYRLDEYKCLVRDFVAADFKKNGKAVNRMLPWNWPIVEAAIFGLFIPVVFAFKKHKVGSCFFTFSEVGLSRASKGGTHNVTWGVVKIVHHYSVAYLIEFTDGAAMPVPYRVFTAKQRELFEALIQRSVKSAA